MTTRMKNHHLILVLFLSLFSIGSQADENKSSSKVMAQAAKHEITPVISQEEMQALVKQQSIEIEELKKKIKEMDINLGDADINSINESVNSINSEKRFLSYADMAAISISSVSILVTLVGIGIALLSFWGYNSIKEMVKLETLVIAADKVTEEVSIKIQQVASDELKKVIDDGKLNNHLQDAVDFILRSRGILSQSKVSELLSEIDKEEV